VTLVFLHGQHFELTSVLIINCLV